MCANASAYIRSYRRQRHQYTVDQLRSLLRNVHHGRGQQGQQAAGWSLGPRAQRKELEGAAVALLARRLVLLRACLRCELALLLLRCPDLLLVDLAVLQHQVRACQQTEVCHEGLHSSLCVCFGLGFSSLMLLQVTSCIHTHC